MILIVGAAGQIGTELTLGLQNLYGEEHVIATDVRANEVCEALDVIDRQALQQFVRTRKVTQIYLLAAMLSAQGEKNPQWAWALNMQSLLNTLEVAREERVRKIFWPSSIAVFGRTSPKINTPQQTIMEPTTIYGISKLAGEQWCSWYHRQYGMDIRSLRYPGLISYSTAPGGGTTDYAVAVFHEAVKNQNFNCYLRKNCHLPMMYMPDAIRATIELMESPAEQIRERTSYNISGMSFSPGELVSVIQDHVPGFDVEYQPDYRQVIADSWPKSIDDSAARKDWGWRPSYDLHRMSEDMIRHIRGMQEVNISSR